MRIEQRQSKILGWNPGDFADAWGKVIFVVLCLAILCLGVLHTKIPYFDVGFSTKSFYRAVFISWLSWKVFLWLGGGTEALLSLRSLFPVPLLIFFASVTISLLPDFEHSADYFRLLIAFVHYLMVVDLFSENQKSKLLLYLLALGPSILFIRGVLFDPAVLSLDNVVRLGYRADLRFGYPTDYPNTAGYVFAMGIPLSIALLAGKGWIKRLAGVSCVAQLAGLILTYSRGAWIGCVVSLFCVGLMEKRFRRVLLGTGFAALLLFISITPFRNRLTSVSGIMLDHDIGWRFQVMTHATSMGLEQPLLGVGYGSDHLRAALDTKYPEFSKQRYVHHSHNVYTELLAGTGFLGLGALLNLLGFTLMRLLRKFRDAVREEDRILSACLIASVVAFIVTGLWDVPFYHEETRVFFFTLLALIHIHLSKGLRPDTGMHLRKHI